MSHTTDKMKETAGLIAKAITEQGKILGVDECIVDDFGPFGNFSLLCYLDMDIKFHNHVWNFTSKNFKLMPIVLLIKKVIKQYEKDGAKLRTHYSPEGIYQSNSCGGMRFKSTFIGYNERYISIDLDFIPYHAESNTFAVQTQQPQQGQLNLF